MSQIKAKHGDQCAEHLSLPSSVGGVDFQKVVWEAAADRGEIDLLKMDADGPEGTWLRQLERMISGPRHLKVRTIIVEGSNLEPRVLERLQSVHGYTVLRLDEHDERRRVTRSGWDAYSPGGTIAPLDRFRAAHRKTDLLPNCKYKPRGTGREAGCTRAEN